MTSTPVRVLLFAALGVTLIHAQAPGIPMPAGANVLLGRVVEMGTDAPVAGAIVTLTGQFDATGNPATPDPMARGPAAPPSVYVMTTADGYFVFRNLPAGKFTAATRALGYQNSDYTQIEIHDSPKPIETRLSVWKYAALGGRVVDERGESVAGIPVTALRPASTGGGGPMRAVANELTDDRGVYRISQLSPGNYAVAIFSTTTTLPANVAAALDPGLANRDTYSAMMDELMQSGLLRTWGCPTCISNPNEGQRVEGFVLQRPGMPLPPAPDGRPLGFANTFFPGTLRPQDATIVSLGSGESRTDLDLAVRLTPTVRITGVLTGPDGPMTHARLSLAPPGADLGTLDPPGIATAITDERGAFAFFAVMPGDYTLSGSMLFEPDQPTDEGRQLWTSQSLTVRDAGVMGLTVTMRPGLRTSGRVEFKNATGGVANPPAQSANPASRQTISLQPVRAQFWRNLRGVVQPDGTFRTPGDAPGRYLLYVSSPPGWYWQTTLLAGRPVRDDVVELTSTELSGLVFTFGQTTNRISGRVSDGTGAADPDATVIVVPADSNVWSEIASNSRRTRVVRATPAGSYDVATFSPGDYYIAAINLRPGQSWLEPQVLQRLIAGATKITLGVTDEKTVALRTIVQPGR